MNLSKNKEKEIQAKEVLWNNIMEQYFQCYSVLCCPNFLINSSLVSYSAVLFVFLFD